MASRKHKIGYLYIMLGALATAIILISLQLRVKAFLLVVGLNLLPYLLMFFLFRKVEEDEFINCNLFVLLLVISGELYILIDASFFHPNPFIPLIIPIVQFLVYLVLHGAVELLRVVIRRT